MFTDGTAVDFTLLKHIWMLKLLMEKLAQFALAVGMLIIIQLSVLAFRGHKLHGKDSCAWHAEKSQPFNRKQFSVTSLSHIHLTT